LCQGNRRSDIALEDPSVANTCYSEYLPTTKVDEQSAYALQKYNTLSPFLALECTNNYKSR